MSLAEDDTDAEAYPQGDRRQRGLSLVQPMPDIPQPPSAVEAEQALLGALLANNGIFHKVADRLEALHFEHAVHGRIYQAISDTIDGDGLADLVTMSRLFASDRDLAQHGGSQYIARLVGGVVTIIGSETYAEAIIDTWRRRQIIQRAWQAIHEAAEPDMERDAVTIARELGDGIASLSDDQDRSGAAITLREAMQGAQRLTEHAVKRGGLSGLSTGIKTLDERCHGLFPGHLIYLGGRPSMGKSALVQTIGSNVARTGKTVGFWSLEMQPEDIGWREMSGATGYSVGEQMTGAGEFHAIDEQSRAIDEIGNAPLYIFPRGGIGLSEIQRQARSLQRKRGLSLIIVDHLQLMRMRGKAENRRLELGAISGGLKALAKELGVPVIALSQLSRACELRDDKRPVISDLRETGDIEQDADSVWLLFREEYYLKQQGDPAQRQNEKSETFEERKKRYWEAMARCRNAAEVILSKQRFAESSVARLRFDGKRSRFGDIEL